MDSFFSNIWQFKRRLINNYIFSTCCLRGCNIVLQPLPLSCESRWRHPRTCHTLWYHSVEVSASSWKIISPPSLHDISSHLHAPSCGGLGAVWTCRDSDCISDAHKHGLFTANKEVHDRQGFFWSAEQHSTSTNLWEQFGIKNVINWNEHEFLSISLCYYFTSLEWTHLYHLHSG